MPQDSVRLPDEMAVFHQVPVRLSQAGLAHFLPETGAFSWFIRGIVDMRPQRRGAFKKGLTLMFRILLASIIGALVAFAWGFVAWAALDLYHAAFRPLPNEDAVIAVLKTANSPTAAYPFPSMPDAKAGAAVHDAWVAKHKAGPVGIVFYRANGAEPMELMTLVRGYGIQVIACFLLACMMVAGHLQTWGMRFTLSVIMAAFAVMVSHASNWNWMFFPDAYSMSMATDVMIGWMLAGAVVAMIVRPAPAKA